MKCYKQLRLSYFSNLKIRHSEGKIFNKNIIALFEIHMYRNRHFFTLRAYHLNVKIVLNRVKLNGSKFKWNNSDLRVQISGSEKSLSIKPGPGLYYRIKTFFIFRTVFQCRCHSPHARIKGILNKADLLQVFVKSLSLQISDSLHIVFKNVWLYFAEGFE